MTQVRVKNLCQLSKSPSDDLVDPGFSWSTFWVEILLRVCVGEGWDSVCVHTALCAGTPGAASDCGMNRAAAFA